MDEKELDTSPAAKRDEPSGRLAGTPIQQVAGGSYREEAQRLIDEQIALLFATVEQAAAQRGGQAAVRRGDRSLTVGSGGAMVEFAVEAITDVPADADPARDFPQGEARCKVRTAGATLEEWVLSRTDQGSENAVYHWLRAATGSQVTPADIQSLIRS